MSMEFRMVYITAPSIDSAKSLSRKLVESNAVACVNIIPQITSVYRWEGKLEESEEVLMIAKTVEENVDTVKELVNASHPYDVPEVIAVPITEGSQKYLNWIRKETNKK